MISVLEFEFGDESINEWNLSQMEYVLHSMDLSMKVSERFWCMENAPNFLICRPLAVYYIGIKL